MGKLFKRILAPAMGIAVAMSFASISRADDLTPPGAGVDGWFNGAGVSLSQGGWTVDSSNGIELGLRAKIRQGDVIDPSGNVYTVPGGFQQNDPSGLDKHIAWNYEFSIDVDPGGALNPGGPTLADVSAATITVTDLNTSSFASYNPLALDDCAFGSGATGGKCSGTGTHIDVQSSDFVAQNSENPLFPVVFPSGYNASDSYEIQLSVTVDRVTTSEDIIVNQVPEPTAVILFGTVALGLIVVKRRRTAGVPTV
jgi:hypothetical protein